MNNKSKGYHQLVCEECGILFTKPDKDKNPYRFCDWHCYMIYRRRRSAESIVPKFLNKVDQQGPDDCWEWKGKCDVDGYGLYSCWISGVHFQRANRVAWRIHAGFIIPALKILHGCNNPPCCNPSHLYPGTSASNAKDRVEARSLHGERNAASKVTEEQVREMREAWDNRREKQRHMAARLGIHKQTVNLIVNHKTWTHIV